MKSKKSFFHGHEGFVFVAMAMVIAPVALAVQVFAQSTSTKSVATFAKLTATLEATPLTRMVAAGKDEWISVARYRVANTSMSKAAIAALTVEQANKNGSLNDALANGIAISVGNQVRGTESFPKGSNAKKVELITPLLIEPQSSELVEVWVKLANVVSGVGTKNSWTTVARSGHAPIFRLTGVQFFDFATGVNMATDLSARAPNPVILRKSVPFVTRQSLPTTVLSNSEVGLYKFQIDADGAEEIVWKQMQWDLAKTPNVNLSNFRINTSGAGSIGEKAYDVYARCVSGSATGAPTQKALLAKPVLKTTWNNVKNGSIGSKKCDRILVKFKDGFEQKLGSFVLSATVSGATSGASVTLMPTKFTPGIITGSLVGTIATPELRVKSENPLQPAQTKDGVFLWSDLSEGSNYILSKSWSDGSYVMDLSQSQMVSL